jgi:hypothetical protein
MPGFPRLGFAWPVVAAIAAAAGGPRSPQPRGSSCATRATGDVARPVEYWCARGRLTNRTQRKPPASEHSSATFPRLNVNNCAELQHSPRIDVRLKTVDEAAILVS